MTVSLIVWFGSIKQESRDRIALKLYIERVISPGQDLRAYEMAFEFCFKMFSLAKRESVKAVKRTSSSYPERRYFLRWGASSKKMKADVRLSDAS
jgi:hypothetical protein